MTALTAAGVPAALDARLEPTARRWFEAREVDGLPLLLAEAPTPFMIAFTTRCSEAGVFSVARGEGANRARLLSAIRSLDAPDGGAQLELVSPKQEHGLRVVGAAEYRREPAEAGADGLTLHPELDAGLAALLLFADCVPVVLLGEVDVAVVHGGWRGVVGGVVQQGARAMTAPPGAAVVGPSIGPCCFAVGEDVARAFADRYGTDVVLPGPRVDLWAAVERALGEVGVPASGVRNPRLCTVCNADIFFSHRADGGTTGRHAAAVWSKEK